jgi:hypothetical protein
MEVWLAIIDKLFFAPRHCFRRIFDGVEVERLAHIAVCGHAADAKAKLFA